MIVFTDGANFDDTIALITLLKTGTPINLIVITANGWSESAPAYTIFSYITRWFNRDIPIIVGSLHAWKDKKKNREKGEFIQGKMFGRAVPAQFLFELGIAYSYISWLPTTILEDKFHHADFMDKIMEHIDKLDYFDVLSLGALTDVAGMVCELDKNNELCKIRKVFHVGGGVNIQGTVFTIDRSEHASYNVYLDPDAAQYCLSKIGEKMHWITPQASGSVQFSLKELEKVVNDSTTPEGIWAYIYVRERLLGSVDIPVGQVPDQLIVWDVIAAIITLNPHFIKTTKKQKVSIVTSSNVCIKEDCDYTYVTYKYDNELGEMHCDRCGHLTNVITELNVREIREKFYEILGSQEHTATCNLQKPKSCYKGEEITSIPPFEQ